MAHAFTGKMKRDTAGDARERFLFTVSCSILSNIAACVLTTACRVGADVAILISGSGIVGEQNYQRMLDFARHLVYGINVNRVDSQIAVVVFSDDAHVRFYLNDFNNFTLPSSSSSSFPDDYVYTQIHALNAVSNHYPCAVFLSACSYHK